MASFVSGGGGGGSVQQHIFTGTCETAAATPEKAVTLDDSSGFSLAAGVRVAVTFKYGNSATTPTLNVSSSGAKNIVFNSSATAYTSGLGTTNNTWGAYETVIFTYTGSYWTHALSSWGAINTLMKKGTDYVTAGQKSGTTLGTRATTEGYNTTASGNYAHAEGDTTVASGLSSHAEGSGTTASGEFSHAEGYETTAQRKSQHVLGEFNVLDNGGTDGTTRGTYVEIVGNGTNSARSNARTLDWSGNEVLAGKLTVGAAPTNNMDVATKKYVDDAIPTVPAQVSKLYTATCPTAAATAAKVATLDDSTGFSLTVGVRVAVTFTYGNTATTPTLNVSSSGAKTIAIPSSATAFTTGSGTTYNTWGAYETVIFTYTGTYWVHEPSGYQTYLLSPKASPALTGTPTAPTAAAGTNTTQIATTAFVQNAVSGVPAQISKIYTGTCTTDYLTAAKVVTLDDATGFSLVDGRKVLVTFTNGNNYQGTATVNVNSTGAYNLNTPAGINAYVDNNYLSSNFITAGETILLTYKSGTGWIQTASASLATGASISLSSKADTDSPALTGTPTAPTAADGTNTTQIATTAFVQNALGGVGGGNWETVYSESINKTIIASKGQNTQIEIIGSCSTKITSSMGYGMYRWVFVGNITGSGAIRLGGSSSYYISLVAPQSNLTFITPSFIALYYSSSIGNHYYPASTTVSSSSVPTLEYVPNLTLYTKSTTSSSSSITANGTVYLQRAVL